MFRSISTEIPNLKSRFSQIEAVGEGSYGQVTKCMDNKTKQVIALKKINNLKEKSDFEKKLYREITILKKLDHPNISRLYEVIYVKSEDSFYLELEYCEHDLFSLITGNVLTVEQTKSIMRQILLGLSYLNQNGVLHRDIKPANILIKGGNTVKIADFGLAKVLDGNQNYSGTSHIITLIYRPLELLLGETEYGSEVDIWSTALVFYQLMTGKFIFAKTTSENQMIANIIAVCGTPDMNTWPELKKLSNHDKVLLLKPVKSTIEKHFANINKEYGPIVDWVKKMLNLNPKMRPTAQQLLDSGDFDQVTAEPIEAEEIHVGNAFDSRMSHQDFSPMKVVRPPMPMPVLVCY